MTSKLTREERVQALYELKVGQALSLADIEMSRTALAAMDSEPVVWTSEEAIAEVYCDETAMMGPKHMVGDVALYRHAQPAPVVPDDVSIFEAAIEECKTCDSIDEHAWNHGVLAVIAKYESCRAAMLAAAQHDTPLSTRYRAPIASRIHGFR